jgi:hypothetical protein
VLAIISHASSELVPRRENQQSKLIMVSKNNITDKQVLDSSAAALTSALTDAWESIRKAPEEGAEVTETSINLQVILSPEGQLEASVKSFLHKLDDGRKIRITPAA